MNRVVEVEQMPPQRYACRAPAADDRAAVGVAPLEGHRTDVAPEVELLAGKDHHPVEVPRRDADVRAIPVAIGRDVPGRPCRVEPAWSISVAAAVVRVGSTNEALSATAGTDARPPIKPGHDGVDRALDVDGPTADRRLHARRAGFVEEERGVGRLCRSHRQGRYRRAECDPVKDHPVLVIRADAKPDRGLDVGRGDGVRVGPIGEGQRGSSMARAAAAASAACRWVTVKGIGSEVSAAAGSAEPTRGARRRVRRESRRAGSVDRSPAR